MAIINEITELAKSLNSWGEKTDDLVTLENLNNLSPTELDSMLAELKKRNDQLTEDVNQQHAEGVAGYAAQQAELSPNQNQ
jgi:hypothetical protein